jgi:hypothetical protein
VALAGLIPIAARATVAGGGLICYKCFQVVNVGNQETLMSKGPGRIERAIERLFLADPEMTYSLDELAQAVYPGVNRVEKKHRVAVLRAAWNVTPRLWWDGLYISERGRPVIFFNQLNARSRAIAQQRSDHWTRDHAKAAQKVDAEAANPEPGCRDTWRLNHRRADLLRASIEGDDYRQDWLMAEEQEWRDIAHQVLAANARLLRLHR